MKPAPCVNCLITPICRLKPFLNMRDECIIVKKYLYKPNEYITARNDFDIRIERVIDAIKPTKWYSKYIGGFSEAQTILNHEGYAIIITKEYV